MNADKQTCLFYRLKQCIRMQAVSYSAMAVYAWHANARARITGEIYETN